MGSRLQVLGFRLLSNMGHFRELNIWKEAMSLTEEIYRITSKGLLSKDFGLRDQLRRAAVSIPSNIAEGDELNTNKQSINHLYISKGSLAELSTQLEIAERIGYMDQESFVSFNEKCAALAAKINKLISYRKKHLQRPLKP